MSDPSDLSMSIGQLASGTEAEAIAELVNDKVEIVDQFGAEGGFALVTPSDREVQTFTNEEYRPVPDRRRGNMHASTVQTFVDLVQDAENPALRIYSNDGELDCVVNDHTGHAAGHGDHLILYRPHQTVEHRAIVEHSGEWMTQHDLLELLEEIGHTVVEPPQADMMELVQSFEASTEAKFRSGERLKDGSRQLLYAEDTTASAGGGTVVIPDEITFHCQAFRRMDHELNLTASFRYRIREGVLTLRYLVRHLDQRLDELHDLAIGETEAATGMTVHHGYAVKSNRLA